jgi:hypothetical protein
MPGGNQIIIPYRNHRALFGDDAVFDVIVTKRAKRHKSEFRVQISSTDTHGWTQTEYLNKNIEWILIIFLFDPG